MSAHKLSTIILILWIGIGLSILVSGADTEIWNDETITGNITQTNTSKSVCIGTACFSGYQLTINGDSYQNGTHHGNILYGELFHINTSGTTLSFTGQDTYSNLTFLETSELNGFTNGGGILVPSITGTYKAEYHISFEGQTGSTHGMGIFVNGIKHDPCYGQRKLGNSDVGNAGGTCIFTATTNSNITLAMDDEDIIQNDVQIITANLNVIKIGN